MDPIIATTNSRPIIFSFTFISWCMLLTPSESSLAKTISSPCLYKKDVVYKGILVDCQGQGLSTMPPIDWIPPRTTTLLLQNNAISSLDRDSLSKVTELRHLSLAVNIIDLIEPTAFRMNKKLEFLDFQFNKVKLDRHSVKYPWFSDLRSLIELRMAYNNNDALENVNYPSHLLAGLANLRILSLDTFSGDLHFNGIFKETRNLSSLLLTGGVHAIRNESFADFDAIDLKQLSIDGAQKLRITEQGAFGYLKSLDSYSLSNSPQGTAPTLASLAPFVHRNFTKLSFNRILIGLSEPGAFTRDSILSSNTTRYLSQICVQNFEFIENNLFFVEVGSMTSPLWSRCLVTLDISLNPLLGEVVELMHLAVLQMLQSVKVTNRKYSIFNKDGRLPMYNSMAYATYDSNQHNVIVSNVNISKSAMKDSRTPYFNSTNETDFRALYFHHSQEQKINKNGHENKHARIGVSNVKSHEHSVSNEGNYKAWFLFLPKDIAYINLAGFGAHTSRLDFVYNVKNADNLEELHMSDSGLYSLTGTLYGLENVKILDISKNDGSDMKPSFINSFPNIYNLNMSNMGLSKMFMSSESRHLFMGLSKLESLDLSGNNIYTLQLGTFSQNKKLKHLNLAGNHFKSIPFHIGQLPNLRTLGLGFNSFLQLSHQETRMLEQHVLHCPQFSITLYGNVFSCSCSSIRFLLWLKSTKVSLDNNRNFSCTLENGETSTTCDAKDVKGLWRHCAGETSFLTSLILLCLIALGFSLVAFCMKFKTQITTAIFQYFRKNFTLKTPQDYDIGVYMGYSDEDNDLACCKLRTFIENQVRLTTYVRHRDLLPASDIAASIVTAVNSSWRVLLLVTDSYLDDRWSYLAMKTAVYSVGTSNPGRLVVVILSDEVGHRIPKELLTAVREDSIIKLTKGEDCLTDEEEEALRQALLC